jgi:hypothetical protein
MLKEGTKVVVFTQWQSVYFGELSHDYMGEEDHLTLLNSRHGYALDTTHGAWQICTDGPGKEAKIGPKVPVHMVLGVANIAVPTPKAVEAWENSTWSRT